MSRRRANYDHVDYTQLGGAGAATAASNGGRSRLHRLHPHHSDTGFIDAQFAQPESHVPWKAVALAAALMVAGTVMLVTGSLVVSGHIDTRYADRMWPMIILGVLMFIPGAYHTRIAYYAFNKVPGYSFDDIPEFD